MSAPGSEDQLPCGASVAALLDQVDSGRGGERTAHQESCVVCQAALAELTRLWEPLRALAAEPVSAPPALVRRVMGRVRDLAAQPWFAVLPDVRGSTRIAARVIAVLAREAAQRVPGVRVALGGSTRPAAARAAEEATRSHRYPGAAVGSVGSHVAIDLALATAYGADIPRVAERVRRTVVAEVRAATGVEDVEVNITVDDVLGGG